MLVNERVLMIYPSDLFSVEFSQGISTVAVYFENKFSVKVVLQKMTYTTNTAERDSRARNKKTIFLNFVANLKMVGKKHVMNYIVYGQDY